MASSPSATTAPSPPPLLPPGRILLTLVALMTSTACFVADWNESHIYNHTWPGHAKFHNGQTMSMGLLLGVAALYYLYRAPLLAAPLTRGGPPPTTATTSPPIAKGADSTAKTDAQTTKTTTTADAEAALTRLRKDAAHRDLGVVVLLNSLYWVTQLSAHAYPDVTAFDPVPGSARFGPHQDAHLQKKLDLSMFVVVGVAWWLERRRIERGQF
ncbi:hypothetical protein IWX90DRAFT_302605 [Phyllosticta citrichinensis]|uniref:Uncharacterized protein n=1 Tax=Phyllosticta citrichinensis TaxID=1130410 RepID=A0ABR1XL58_9PEZI